MARPLCKTCKHFVSENKADENTGVIMGTCHATLPVVIEGVVESAYTDGSQQFTGPTKWGFPRLGENQFCGHHEEPAPPF